MNGNIKLMQEKAKQLQPIISVSLTMSKFSMNVTCSKRHKFTHLLTHVVTESSVELVSDVDRCF